MPSSALLGRSASRAVVALCGLLVVTWGLCPCALGRAIRSALGGSAPVPSASASPAAEVPTRSCCCGEHRDICPSSERGPGSEKDRGPVRKDCPKCIVSGCHGSLAAPETAPVLADAASVVAPALPVPALRAEALRQRSVVRPDGTGAPPPFLGVETTVLLI